jgi:hypothetical protein
MKNSLMARPILNIEELEFRPWSRGDKFEAELGAPHFRRTSPSIQIRRNTACPRSCPNAEGKLESVRFITHAQATADDYWQGKSKRWVQSSIDDSRAAKAASRCAS